jgi:predicted enzyme related to lactoylglutathione lyase
MDGQLVHFELPVTDSQRALGFWKSLFGWKFQDWDGPVEYHMLSGNEPGGAIYPDEERGGSGPIIYFGTSDIDQAISRARELGGAAEDKQPIPGIGWFARCTDTEGNAFSLFQPDDSVPPPGGN